MKQPVVVEGRRLALTNLDKVLYPEVRFTKAEVIDYYSRVAPAILPHLKGRPLTVKRYPNGVNAPYFYEKNAPSHTPEWIPRATLPVPGSTMDRETVDFALVEDLPALVYYANLAALELHVPMWRVGHDPDLIVFDLDPGPPATIVDCCRVAVRLRAMLEEDGRKPYPKTSGRKGMQLYVPDPPEDPRGYAKEVAERMESEYPDQAVSRMTKKLRRGKVFIDWDQNKATKTTIAPYSLRAESQPTVSTPLSWEEVENARSPEELVFTADEVLERVAAHGDHFSDLGLR